MDTSQLKPTNVSMAGGLVLNVDPFSMPPSAAQVLTNIEPSIQGGYRRISGYIKFNTNALTGTGSVLGVSSYNGLVVGCRGANVETTNGTGAWNSITTSRTSAGFYCFTSMSSAGTELLIMADGVNPAGRWDGTTYSTIDHTLALTAPSLCAEFNNSLCLVEGTQLMISSPHAENDFAPANGAVVFALPDNITAIKKHRQALYIFGPRFIRKLTGFGQSSYNLEHVTDSVGCVASRSVQEIGGDLLYFAADGLRTIAGTAKIDDVEMGAVSRSIQPLLSSSSVPAPETNYICSAVVRDKSQYRMFTPVVSTELADSLGIIAVAKEGGFEFATTRGIRPTCADDVITGVAGAIVVHGDENGYVYRQEEGKLFDDMPIEFKYQTAEFMFDDPGIRHELQRIILNLDQEGRTKTLMNLKYNFEDADSPQPETYYISEGGDLSIYGSAVYGTSTYAIEPVGFLRQPVEGSGFTASLIFTDDTSLSAADSSDSFTFKGIQIEHINAGRR